MLRLGLARRVGPLVASAMLAKSAAPTHHRYVADCIDRAARVGLVEAMRSISLGRPDLVERLPRVACPTLFVAGSDDAMWPPALARAHAAKLPTGRAEALDGAAHLGPLERPEEVVRLLRTLWNDGRGDRI